eukprot:3935768-Rhodomonas_salina.1
MRSVCVWVRSAVVYAVRRFVAVGSRGVAARGVVWVLECGVGWWCASLWCLCRVFTSGCPVRLLVY